MGDDIPVPKPIVAVPAAVVVYPGKDWPLIEVQRVLHRERQMGSLGRFGNVEAGGKGVAQVGDVGDGKDTGKIGGKGVDGGDELITPLLILATEALVDDEHLESQPRPLGQDAGQGQS